MNKKDDTTIGSVPEIADNGNRPCQLMPQIHQNDPITGSHLSSHRG